MPIKKGRMRSFQCFFILWKVKIKRAKIKGKTIAFSEEVRARRKKQIVKM